MLSDFFGLFVFCFFLLTEICLVALSDSPVMQEWRKIRVEFDKQLDPPASIITLLIMTIIMKNIPNLTNQPVDKRFLAWHVVNKQTHLFPDKLV